MPPTLRCLQRFGPRATVPGRSARAQPQRGVRQVVAHRPEARSQAANSKTQDKAGTEAKAGVLGRLRPPGGEDGVAEDSSEAA